MVDSDVDSVVGECDVDVIVADVGIGAGVVADKAVDVEVDIGAKVVAVVDGTVVDVEVGSVVVVDSDVDV